MEIGILALQGDYYQHRKIIEYLGINCINVRYRDDLSSCSALIIPGGESTTLTTLIQRNNFYDVLVEYGKTHPVFGTCAGLIMMSENVMDPKVKSLKYIDITAERNGWGRQVHSFNAPVNLNWENGKPFNAMFIRAPKITRYSKSVKVLADVNGEPVLVQKNNFLASTFHPELVEDYRVHQYFIDMING